MSTKKYVEAFIAVILLIVLVFIAQLLVGVVGVSSSTLNTSLSLAQPAQVSYAGTASAKAINDFAVNSLVLTLSGTTSLISAQNPLTVTVTGNAISAYAIAATYAVAGAVETQTFTITNAMSPQTLSAATGNFYNITAVVITGVTNLQYPTLTGTVSQSFDAITHTAGTHGANTISAANVLTLTQPTPIGQYIQIGSVQSTIIPFITVITVVSLVVILLDLFGVDLFSYFKKMGGE